MSKLRGLILLLMEGEPLPAGSGPPNFYNRVAWVRGPEWVGTPGPEDSYIGGQISPADLQTMEAGNGTVIRMQFQLPAMPSTPCTNGCSLSGNEQLRYWSLSFVQSTTTAGDMIAADPDGATPAASGSTTLVSLADAAFVQATGGALLSSWAWAKT